MPCESCNIQFTVFRRKRSCAECKRFYCSNCLSASRRNNQTLLCERCAIFSKRPLLHSDLLQLKPKDLIFYLQSKHISTTGCVEKDELIRLVLNHIDQNDGIGGSNQNTRNSPNSSDSFDNIRQTCQNFFFNITENISDTLAGFDSKSPTKTPPPDNNNGNSNNENRTTGEVRRESSSNSSNSTHIFDQPRVSRREIPTYASSVNGVYTLAATVNLPGEVTEATTAPTAATTTTSSTTNSMGRNNIQRPTANSHSTTISTSDEQKSSMNSSSAASPIISVSSIASPGPAANEILQGSPHDEPEPDLSLNVPKSSDCECSDDEIFTTYTARNSLTTLRTDADADLLQRPQMTGESTIETQPSMSSSSSQRMRQLDVQDVDETSHSSFEELGAIGAAISEDSGGSSNTDPWNILEPHTEETIAENSAELADDNATVQAQAQATVIQLSEDAVPPRRKLLRRRSGRQRPMASEEDNSPTTMTAANSNATEMDRREPESDLRKRSGSGGGGGTCKRCGKSNLRRYVEKMRSHLESAQLSEADIKREMNDFLAYLDEQTKSLDYSETETETTANSPMSSDAAQQHGESSQIALSPNSSMRNTPYFPEVYGENDGINVYGAEAPTSSSMADRNSRFINLDDYDNFEDLESLSVKQLKEVLMLHRVDYKGCCEKQELLDRVQRLWNNLKSAPAVNKLPTDELCKICMDAPIECVILECGHMATCVTCGKVLSECPICRQYIVRVVRFFRA